MPSIMAGEIIRGNEVFALTLSYKKLWKILIDRDMKKKDLQKATGVSWASVTKLSKGETVSMDVLIKICRTLHCDIGDIVELLPAEDSTSDVNC